jgi:hypothetical protein
MRSTNLLFVHTLPYYGKPVERKGFDELHALIRHILSTLQGLTKSED